MRSFFQELINSLRNNVLRTVLTGSTIAWGILLLVVLLGVGDGMQNGIYRTAQETGLGDIESSLELRPTQLPYGGYQKERELYLVDKQLSLLRTTHATNYKAMEPYFEKGSAVSTDFGESTILCGTLTKTEQGFNQDRLLSGRLFTAQEHDLGERVCLLPDYEVSKLFVAGQNPIGQLVSAWGVTFRVVGTLDYSNPFMGVMKIPYKTYAALFPNEVLKYKRIKIYPRTSDHTLLTRYEEELKTDVRRLLTVDPTDNAALTIISPSDAENGIAKTFRALNIMLWVMGIGSLAIGTIGVTNIMNVTVEERRREIGIRKAIGARPKNILTMILGESLMLSLFFGIIGIALGYLSVDLIGYVVEKHGWATRQIPMGFDSQTSFTVFQDPSVEPGVALGALVVLVVAGLWAGYGPARKATKIPAVIAMRDK